MAVPMTTLRRDRNGRWFARKGIPKDVREAYKAAYGVSQEARFTRPAWLSAGRAKQEFREWDADVSSRIENLRAKLRGEGETLTQRQARALAGEWYNWFVALHEEDPGHADDWLARGAEVLDTYAMYGAGAVEDADSEPSPMALRRVRQLLMARSDVSGFLGQRNIVLTEEAMNLFLDTLEDEYAAALSTLRRRSEGDYSPDERPDRFPQFEARTVSGLTVWALFEAWVHEKQPQPSTVDRWRAVFLNLQSHFSDQDASELTEDDARQWAKQLVTEKRTAKTVQDVWLNAARTVFGWGLGMKTVTSNPFAGVRVSVPRSRRTRETKAFTTDEIKTILRATLEEPPGRLAAHYRAARRWVPWLCAYTGARAGEITQLRGVDIFQREGIWAVKLTVEAGTIKTGKTRTVPLHEHIIAQGFIAFAKSRGGGPLFYDSAARRRSGNKRGESNPTKPGQPPAVKTRNKLAEWVRSLGVDDPEIQPNHAWRHTFKQIAARHRIPDKFSHAITGHEQPTIGLSYGEPTLEDNAAALEQFPRYRIEEE